MQQKGHRQVTKEQLLQVVHALSRSLEILLFVVNHDRTDPGVYLVKMGCSISQEGLGHSAVLSTNLAITKV